MDTRSRPKMLRTVGLLLSFVVLAIGQMRDDGKIEWGFEVTDGSNVTMFCNDTDAEYQPENGDMLTWYTVVEKSNPPRRIETEIEESKKYKFTHENGFDKLYLTVTSLDENDYGLYMCTVRNSSGYVVIRYQKGVNVNGPLILKLSDKYRYHIITAVVAAAVLLGMLLLGCFVYRFRYRAHNNDKNYVVNGYYSSEYPSKTRHGFDNPAIIDDDSSRFTKADIELTEKQSGIEETNAYM